jgi:hypothetical protein
LSAQGITKANSLNVQVANEEGWKKVEGFIKGWMEKLRDPNTVKVKLVLRYKEIYLKEATTGQTQVDSGSGSDKDVDVVKVVKPLRKVYPHNEYWADFETSTTKQIDKHRCQTVIDSTHVKELMRHWKCSQKNCKNYER